MLQILTLVLLSASSVFTAHHYDVYVLYANHHPSVPLRGNVYGIGHSNGHRPVQIYEYSKRYGGVKLSDNVFNQRPKSDSDIYRRVDTQYNYGNYPYQRNHEQDTWNGVSIADPPQLYNQFQNKNIRDNNKYNTVVPTTQKSVQNEQTVVTQSNRSNNLNKIHDNENVTHISEQLNNANRTSVISKPVITWNYDEREQEHTNDNANKTIRSINSSNNTNNVHINVNRNKTTDTNKSITFNPIKVNSTSNNNSFTAKVTSDKHPLKTNDETNKVNINTNINNKVKNKPNVTVNDNRKNINHVTTSNYGTKTTEDNELTPRTENKGEEDDRWIWSNGAEQVETTTLFGLDDRAAFEANGCPDGKIKVGSVCVKPD